MRTGSFQDLSFMKGRQAIRETAIARITGKKGIPLQLLQSLETRQISRTKPSELRATTKSSVIVLASKNRPSLEITTSAPFQNSIQIWISSMVAEFNKDGPSFKTSNYGNFSQNQIQNYPTKSSKLTSAVNPHLLPEVFGGGNEDYKQITASMNQPLKKKNLGRLAPVESLGFDDDYMTESVGRESAIDKAINKANTKIRKHGQLAPLGYD